MKKIYIFLFVTLISTLSFAGSIPYCWDNSERPAVKDGSFLIQVNTDAVTKDELLDVLDWANGVNLRGDGYPIVYSDAMTIVSQGVDYGFGDNRLERKELIEVVEEELAPIADIDGVLIFCNGIVYPIELENR